MITDAERVTSDALETMLSEIARELYFHPPDHAASIINILLASETLKEEWLLELSSMRNRIVSLRQKISKSFQYERQTDFFFFSFLKNQNGMFSLLPISNEGIIQLRKKSGIYLMPDGRINIASVREDQIDYITSEICSLKEFQSRRV